MKETQVSWSSYLLRRPRNLQLALHKTKVRWRFRKLFWPSQNIKTLKFLQNILHIKKQKTFHQKLVCLNIEILTYSVKIIERKQEDSKLTKLSWRWDFSLIFHKYSWNPILICVNHELPPTESLCYIQILFRNAYDNSYVHIFHGWLVKVKIFYYVRWRQTCYDIFLIICFGTAGTGGPGVPFSPKNL